MKYRILSVAARDMADAIEFYENQSSGLGLEFLDEFECVMQRIFNCPNAWTSVSPNQRRCLFRRFPFAVLYAQNQSEILVTAIMDLRFDPSRQQERVRQTD